MKSQLIKMLLIVIEQGSDGYLFKDYPDHQVHALKLLEYIKYNNKKKAYIATAKGRRVYDALISIISI